MDEIKLKEIKFLNDIKSKYILQNIFSYIKEKQKLEMIIYSKNFQKILELDIKDYQKISGKFKIAEKDGDGKEYSLISKNLNEHFSKKEKKAINIDTAGKLSFLLSDCEKKEIEELVIVGKINGTEFK
jgi:hypothetical protein